MNMESLMVGAVAYDAKVVPIWEGIREYFRGAPVEMDVVWFSNYEAQVDALLAGFDRDRVEHEPGVRCGRTTRPTARAGCSRCGTRMWGSQTLLVGQAGRADRRRTDLKGQDAGDRQRRFGAGGDHARHYLDRCGAPAGRGRLELLRFDTDVGKHGDTGTERARGVDRGARRPGRRCCGRRRVVGRPRPRRRRAARKAWPLLDLASVQPLQLHGARRRSTSDRADAWTRHLMAMDWANTDHRRILELEGLHEWVAPGRSTATGTSSRPCGRAGDRRGMVTSARRSRQRRSTPRTSTWPRG